VLRSRLDRLERELAARAQVIAPAEPWRVLLGGAEAQALREQFPSFDAGLDWPALLRNHPHEDKAGLTHG
jgi:hypothetical protein